MQVLIQDASQPAAGDSVPREAPSAKEIGFSVPERYNASAILFDNLTTRAHHTAVTGPAGSSTYEELCGDAAQFGHALLELGLQRGDRVLLFLDDTPAYPAALFGALRAGLVPLLINTLTPPDLLQFYLADSSSRVAVVEAGFADKFDHTACANTQLEKLIIVNGEARDELPVQSLSASRWLGKFPRQLDVAETLRDEMAFWMYSSGSTGRPKGIVHLQHDMPYIAAAYGRHILQVRPSDVCFSVPKIFFAYGLGNSLVFPFSVGATSVLLQGQPRPSAVFGCISHYRPTIFFGLPTLFTTLTKAKEAHSADLSSLRLSISAAEVLSAEVFNDWKALSGLEIIEGLGSTEALHIYLSNTVHKRKLGAAGQRVPGYEIKLLDREGRPVADGEEGILWVRGDSNAPHYWNRPDKTKETMREEGWLYTGDRFIRDSDGFHFFQGRADDLVKVSGQWVYPLEVELCLANHPAVRECVVLAVKLPDGRTTLKAFVAMNEASFDPEVTTKNLQDHVKTTLLPYKYPRIIEFVEELPKTGTGKIDRQTLLKIS